MEASSLIHLKNMNIQIDRIDWQAIYHTHPRAIPCMHRLKTNIYDAKGNRASYTPRFEYRR